MTGSQPTTEGDQLRSLIRYAAVGIGNNLLLFLLMLLLMSAGLAAWQATLVVYPSGVLISYVLNKFWSFNKRPRRKGQALSYVILYGAAYPIAMGTAWLVEIVSGNGALAALASIAVSAVFIFAGLSYWVFRRQSETPPGI